MNRNNKGDAPKTPSRFPIANLWMWLVCLLAAFVLWAYVMVSDPPADNRDFYELTVNLVGKEQVEQRNLALYGGIGSTVDVNISGKRSVISRSLRRFSVSSCLSSGADT